jgi:phosphoglycolate phosphatase-like HAD superfamily hydrolase
MRKPKPIFAIAYDFDGTLAPGNMQEHSFIPALGHRKATDFWNRSNEEAVKSQGDPILLYMRHMLEGAHHAGVKVDRKSFRDHGGTIPLFPGVEDWFARVNTAGKERGLDVQHFIISSGMRDIIEGTAIRKYFKSVFASGFLYDQHDVAVAPALAVNYTNKTQYLFRINKGALDLGDHKAINARLPPEARPVPFSRMVFIGDGETDVPCFRLVKDQGGGSIAVYARGKINARARAKVLHEDGRVHFAVPADYSAGKALEERVLAFMDRARAETVLATLDIVV